MSSYPYLDNEMRKGASAHNAMVSLSGTAISVQDYSSIGYGAANPLLVRFSPTTIAAVTSGSLTHDFGTAPWGLPPNDGAHVIYVGLQWISNSSVQVVCCISQEAGNITSTLNANTIHPYMVSGPTSQTGEVVWIATIHNVLRTGGGWNTTSAYVEASV